MPSRSKDQALFFEKLAQMQQSGLPLREALDLTAVQLVDSGLRRGWEKVRLDVHRGASLTQAAAKVDGLLTPLMVALLRAGEEHGRLDKALVDLAELCRREDRTRRDVLGAVAYPVFLLLLAVLLPPAYLWYTQGFAAYARSVVGSAGSMALPVVLAYVGYRLLRVLVPEAYDLIVLALPVVGGQARRLAFARFCSALSALLSGGVELVAGVELAVDALGNRALIRRARPAVDAVRRGEDLARALLQTGAFPAEVVQRVGIAERAGQLDRTLLRMADELQEDAQRNIRGWLKALPVIVLLLVGLRIATTVIGFYSGYIDRLDQLDSTLKQGMEPPQL